MPIKDKALLRAYNRSQYLKQRPARLAYAMAYRLANPAKIKREMQTWNAKNKQRKSDYMRTRYKENPKTVRNYKLKSAFGITLDDYYVILKSQGGVCAICKKAEVVPDKNGKIRDLAVDHNHDTGKIRELLCVGCNTGLGCFKDSLDLLLKAALYLEQHGGMP